MLTYKYTARDPSTGQKVESELQASNERAAVKSIMDQGLSVVDIKEKSDSDGLLGTLTGFRSRVKTKDRIIFARQLATLINAGLPLVQSLRSVNDQTESKQMKIIINQIIIDVEGGNQFSDSLAQRPEVFNQVFISLVQAGEASGTLDMALERLATQQEKDAEVLSKVRGALIYPLIVVLVMMAVVIFMLVAVLPQVEELYNGIQGTQLPFVTRALIFISNSIQSYWYIFLAGAGIVGFFANRWSKTPDGRAFFDKAKLHTPPFGQLFAKLYMARFARTGSTLIASGVPLIQVLEIVTNAINNVQVADSLKRATEMVKGGRSLADSLEGDPNFLPLVPNMLRIGEQSGTVEQMMQRTAIYFEKEVDNQIKTVSTIIEPLLMVILGVVAITIVAAILLPIYSLVGNDAIR